MTSAPRSGAFLQSEGWLEIQKRTGKQVMEGMIRQKLGPFFYWYLPRGEWGEVGSWKLEDRRQRPVFIRIDFPVEYSSFQLPNSKFHFTPAPHDVQPRTTILIDLAKSEEELLRAMHTKTRYNIGLSERHGVRVQRQGVEDIDIFLNLLSKTTEHDAFRAHAKSYYAHLLEPTNDPELKIFLSVAYVGERPAAAAIVCDYGGTRTYLHGASDYELRDQMASFALHWFLIKEAKAQGLIAYDFWGIAPTDNPKEPLAGVSRFKKGWGGEIVCYPQTQDLILRPWLYRIYRLVHRIW